MSGYSKTVWRESSIPSLSGPNLNKIEHAIELSLGVNCAEELRVLPVPVSALIARIVPINGSSRCFRWDPSSDLPDNGHGEPRSAGTVIKPSACIGLGRWIAVDEHSPVNKLDFIPLINAYSEIGLGGRSILINEPVVNFSSTNKITGQGWSGKRADYSGSALHFVPSAFEGLHFEASTAKFGAVLRDFCIINETKGYSLIIDNFIGSVTENILIDCAGIGKGVIFRNNAFFSTLNQVRVIDFVGSGITLDGVGSQHTLNQCQTSAGILGSAGVEIHTDGVVVNGGQHNVSKGGEGIGLLWYNKEKVNKFFGTANDVLTEVDIGYVIDGNTKPFRDIRINQPRMTLTKGKTLIKFLRATDCILSDPILTNTGGVLAEFGAASVNCGIRIGRVAAYVRITAHPAAYNPWVQVTEQITLKQRDRIGLDSNGAPYTNLTIICDDVKGLGRCLRKDGVWDKQTALLVANDSVITIKSPLNNTGGSTFGNGMLFNILSNSNPGCCASVAVSHSGHPPELLSSGSLVRLEPSFGILTGTASGAGKLLLRYDYDSSSLNIQNRTGAAMQFKVSIDSYG